LDTRIQAREKGVAALLDALERGSEPQTVQPRLAKANADLREMRGRRADYAARVAEIDRELASPRYWTMAQRVASLERSITGLNVSADDTRLRSVEQRVARLERSGRGSEPAPVHGNPAREDEPAGPGLAIGAVVEFEAVYESQDGESATDFALATFELGVEAELAPWLKGHALMLWEEDGTEPVDLDEAAITIGGTDGMPLCIEAGKLYVPFGAFETRLVSDPIALDLGETRESALVFGYGAGIVELQVAVFNGDLDENDDDHIGDVVCAVGFAPGAGTELGVYWTSDLGESDGLEEQIAENLAAGAPAPAAYEGVGGAGVFFSVDVEPVALCGEFLAALGDFEAGLLGDTALSPNAWYTELALTLNESWELAVRVEGSEDLPGAPSLQYGAAVACALSESAGLALEYQHGTFDGEAGDRDAVTGQMAIEF